MDHTRYSLQVQGWIHSVEEYREKDAGKTLEFAQKLEDYGRTTADEGIQGFAWFYMAETYYVLNDVEHFFQYIMKDLEYLQNSGQWELLARAYNLMGIVSNGQGNAPFALDYYLRGITVCRQHGLEQFQAVIEYNMGTIYITYGEYKRAIHYFENSWQGLEVFPRNEGYYKNKCVVSIALASCYLELGDMERTQEYLSQADATGSSHMDTLLEIYYLCVEARYYRAIQEREKRDHDIARIGEKLNSNLTILDIFEDFFSYCRMLLEIESYEALWQVLGVLDEVLDTSKLIYLQRRLLGIKISYYDKIGDKDEYLQAAGRYYELSCLKEQEERYLMGSMLNTRFSLEEARRKEHQAQEEKRILRRRSETDTLTGIANRLRLNLLGEELFEQALMEQQYLAVEILDVDYFKEYNDNYGHQRGDYCLCQVAGELKRLERQGDIYAFRYGGDEFVMIYAGYSPKEVEELAHQLKDQVYQLAMEHEFSKASSVVTISQGICCEVPQSQDSMWDFLQSADHMLYQVKRHTRNGVQVGTCRRLGELSQSGTDTEL